MKKTLLFIGILLAIVWLSVRIFMEYKATHLMSDGAVFNTYIDISPEEVDDYFGLEEGTFDPEKHRIICRLPVEVESYEKPQCSAVNFSIQTPDCSQEFNNHAHIQYDTAELKGNTFKLMIIRDRSTPLMLINFDMAIFSHSVKASKEIVFDYKRGRINNIVFSAGGAVDYCTKITD
jgi:hypothetical protein